MFLHFLLMLSGYSDIIPDRSLAMTSDHNIYFLSLFSVQFSVNFPVLEISDCFLNYVTFNFIFKQLGKHLNWF